MSKKFRVIFNTLSQNQFSCLTRSEFGANLFLLFDIYNREIFFLKQFAFCKYHSNQYFLWISLLYFWLKVFTGGRKQTKVFLDSCHHQPFFAVIFLWPFHICGPPLPHPNLLNFRTSYSLKYLKNSERLF